MLRKVLGVIVITGFVGIGMVLGFMFRHNQSAGTVLGATTVTPFWVQKTLLVGGNDRHILVAWDGNTDPALVAEFSGRSVVTAAVSTDAKTAIVVTQEKGKNILWQVGEQNIPTVLASVDGVVQHPAFAANSRFLTFLQQRTGNSTELDVLDLQQRSITRITEVAQNFVWLPESRALVSFSNDGTIQYHEMNLDGSFFPAQTLTKSLSTVGVLADGRRLVYVTSSDTGLQLVTYDLITKEQRLVAPLADLALSDLQGLLQLIVAPGADHALLFLPKPTQDSVLADVDLRAGTLVVTQIQAHAAQWISPKQALLEETKDGQPQLTLYSQQSHTEQTLHTSIQTGLVP